MMDENRNKNLSNWPSFSVSMTIKLFLPDIVDNKKR